MKKPSTEYIFLSLVTVFVLLLAFFTIPFSDSLKQPLFLVAAFLGLLFLAIGIRLIFRARKEKGKVKFFLMLTGISTILPLVGTLLHNFFYALAETYVNYAVIFEILHGGFFLISIIVAPILFIVGVVGSLGSLSLKKGTKKWIIIILIGAIAVILASNLLITHETFKTDSFSIKYPEEYSITNSDDRDKVLIIEKEEDNDRRVEVYDTNYYETEDIIHGYSSSGLDEFESQLVPKEKITKENYEIWLFYHEGDLEAKEELQKIADSLTIK